MERIDKVLFFLPFLTLADAVSTHFSLALGGREGGFLARPVYERYGEPGLLALSIFAFSASLGCVWFLIYAKTRIAQEKLSEINRNVLLGAVIFFFLLEAYLMGVAVQNSLVPLLLSFPTLLTIQYGVSLTYFALASFYTRTEMRRLISD